LWYGDQQKRVTQSAAFVLGGEMSKDFRLYSDNVTIAQVTLVV
jgi:hypothetical protein